MTHTAGTCPTCVDHSQRGVPAQREGFETYFVVDAVGGSTTLAHDTAIQRMVQAGSQPITLNSLLTEWIRDWGTTPCTKEFLSYMK